MDNKRTHSILGKRAEPTTFQHTFIAVENHSYRLLKNLDVDFKTEIQIINSVNQYIKNNINMQNIWYLFFKELENVFNTVEKCKDIFT